MLAYRFYIVHWFDPLPAAPVAIAILALRANGRAVSPHTLLYAEMGARGEVFLCVAYQNVSVACGNIFVARHIIYVACGNIFVACVMRD